MKEGRKILFEVTTIMVVCVLLIIFAINISDANTVAAKSVVYRDKFTKYVFVGDSRYVDMKKFGRIEDIFICKVGAGYEFLEEQRDYLRNICDVDTALIIGLGVNDTKNSQKYIDAVNNMARTMDCQVFYMSVNPVRDGIVVKGYQISNGCINIFNNALKENLAPNIVYIDTNEYLNITGYTAEDGVHYDLETTAKSYFFIKRKIKTFLEEQNIK